MCISEHTETTVPVSTATIPGETNWFQRWTGVSRSRSDRLVTGLSAGVALRLGIGAPYVRAAFVVLTFAGGVGIVAYLVGWALTPEAPPGPADTDQRATSQQIAALALILLGLLLGLRATGLWFGAVVWPVALISFGLAVSWNRQGGGAGWFARLTQPGDDTSVAPSRGQIIVGALLMLGGLAIFFATIDPIASLGVALLAVLVTAAGFMLVFGPWVWRLAKDLTAERTERIRSEERAEFAAHLHDSVLQTLALIQRTDDARQMVTLARAQERELRAWLYGKAPLDGVDRVSTALEAVAARVESDHHLPVNIVTVGDVEVDEHVEALVAAAGEAMTNAARHSGADRVSVYAEVEGDQLDVWISDLGAGFDTEAVDPDRRGIAESIRARMERHGGTAEITSSAGVGTEIRLAMRVPSS